MLDGCRAYVGAPKIKRISDELTNEYYRCYYYVKESIPFELTNFFKDDSNCCHKDALNNILNNIVIFNSEVEKDTIFACIKFNIDELKNEVSSNLNNKEILGKLISLKDDDPNADMYKKDYIVNKSIIALLDKYRKTFNYSVKIKKSRASPTFYRFISSLYLTANRSCLPHRKQHCLC